LGIIITERSSEGKRNRERERERERKRESLPVYGGIKGRRFGISLLILGKRLYRRARIRHQCRKTTVLSCRRCLINTVIEKINYI
jgi:hypothetical protein